MVDPSWHTVVGIILPNTTHCNLWSTIISTFPIDLSLEKGVSSLMG